jgi:hypothetical protein
MAETGNEKNTKILAFYAAGNKTVACVLLVV